jgi:type I restriction enzyme M protein
MNNFKEKANLIWQAADLLRGDYKQADYGKVILPMTVLRRLDSVLAPTKQAVLNKAAGFRFHNRSPFDFAKLVADPNHIAANLRSFINGFSVEAREILEYFSFEAQIDRMDDPKADLLFQVVKTFAGIDLADMDSMEMGRTVKF